MSRREVERDNRTKLIALFSSMPQDVKMYGLDVKRFHNISHKGNVWKRWSTFLLTTLCGPRRQKVHTLGFFFFDFLESFLRPNGYEGPRH